MKLNLRIEKHLLVKQILVFTWNKTIKILLTYINNQAQLPFQQHSCLTNPNEISLFKIVLFAALTTLTMGVWEIQHSKLFVLLFEMFLETQLHCFQLI